MNRTGRAAFHSALVGFAVLGAACSGSAVSGHPSAPPSTVPAAVPTPPYGQFLPSDYRVTDAKSINMDGGAVPEVVVSAAGPAPGGVGGATRKIVILAWDRRVGTTVQKQRSRSPREGAKLQA